MSDSENTIMLYKHKSTTSIALQVMIACMGSFYFGYSLGELNMSQDKLNYIYGIENDSNLDVLKGILTSAVPLGAAIGCVITGPIMGMFSRRGIFMGCDIIGIVGCLLFLIENFWVASVARFIMGVLVGINSTIVPLYIREVSPVSISGMTGVFNQGNINFGIVMGYILGLGFPVEQQDLETDSNGFLWRFLLLFPIITCAIRLFFFTVKYTKCTAPYYLINDQLDEAKALVEKDYKEEYQAEILEGLIADANNRKNSKDTWGLIFSDKYRSRMFLGCTLSFLQQFSGINAIVFYSTNIFEETTGDKKLANVMTVVSGLVLMFFAFASGIFSKRYGRKIILQLGAIVLAVILIAAGIVSFITRNDEDLSTIMSVLIIGLIFLFEIMFSLTLGPLTWVYNADILSSEKALGVATSVNWMAAFVIGLVFPSLESSWGIYTMFWIFTGFCILAFFFNTIFVKETLGKSQKQILELFVSKEIDSPLNNEQEEEDENQQDYNQYTKDE